MATAMILIQNALYATKKQVYFIVKDVHTSVVTRLNNKVIVHS